MMKRSVLAGGLLYLWNEWEVQILVLLSFTLQVSLLIFAGQRRHNISRLLRILLWLLYQLADLTATYTIGHMSLSCKPSEHRHLMAFWAPFLLIHLGGQDNISAYAMEDNQLWLRHLLALAVQALGAAYVLYKYIAPSETLLITAAALLFAVGIIKYGERVWALKSSNLDSIIDSANIEEIGPSSPGCSTRQLAGKNELNAEMVLQGAHDMLYICVCQFVDYPVFQHALQHDNLSLFYEKKSIYELIEFQLSLMYDIFYTKAMVIHTWYGRCLRVVTFLATLGSLFLFHFSAGKHGGYKGVDVIVTYILLVGASFLEIASVLRATLSTWTCSLLRARRFRARSVGTVSSPETDPARNAAVFYTANHHQEQFRPGMTLTERALSELHIRLMSLRLRFKLALPKRWSGSIGQHNLVDSCTSVTGLRSLVVSLWDDGSTVISTWTKELVLKEIFRMVGACQGEEEVMRSYRGQCALRLCDEPFLDLKWSTGEFDESIFVWHFATNLLLFFLEKDLEEDLVHQNENVGKEYQGRPNGNVGKEDQEGHQNKNVGKEDQGHPNGNVGKEDQEGHQNGNVGKEDQEGQRNGTVGKEDQEGHQNGNVRKEDQGHQNRNIGKEDQEGHKNKNVGKEEDQGHQDGIIEKEDQGHQNENVGMEDQGHQNGNVGKEDQKGHQNKNVGIKTLVDATNALSNYMMFLLVERPYMLPSPVRHQLHTSTLEELKRRFPTKSMWKLQMRQIRRRNYKNLPPILVRGANLANELLSRNRSRPVVLKMLFGVWVEMLCYAAHHCSRESHARQLNSGGGEFLTVVWLLSATAFHCFYFDDKHRDKRSLEVDVQSFYMLRKRRRTSGTTVA